MSSGRVFHNFIPYTERHIAFMLVRTWTITNDLFWRVECTLEYLVNLLCNWIGKVPWNKLNIIMAVLYLTNSESFNIDISLNIALVWANLSALQISLMAVVDLGGIPLSRAPQIFRRNTRFAGTVIRPDYQLLPRFWDPILGLASIDWPVPTCKQIKKLKLLWWLCSKSIVAHQMK